MMDDAAKTYEEKKASESAVPNEVVPNEVVVQQQAN